MKSVEKVKESAVYRMIDRDRSKLFASDRASE